MESASTQNSRKRKRFSKNLTLCSREHFEFSHNIDEDGVKKVFYVCKICNREINGTTEANLTKHLRCHKDIYEKIAEDDESIEKKRMKLLLDCVEMVTVNGNAFNRLHDSGLLSMIDKTLKELDAAGRGVNLNNSHFTEVKEMLDEVAEDVQKSIRDEIMNRPLSLLVDATTKRRRSILGVSVQLIINGQHVIRSIGMLQLKQSHTGDHLAKVICDLLLKYGIKPQQVIVITTDNGSNVVKMVEGVSAKMIAIENIDSLNVQTAEACDDEIDHYLQNVPDFSDAEALNDVFGSDSEDEDEPHNGYVNILDAVVRNIQNEYECNFTSDIESIRCAAHTLQLCVTDALGQLRKPIQNIISLCHRVAKTMRLKSTANELNEAGIEFSIPHLDVETRWSSTYAMVCLCITVAHLPIMKAFNLITYVFIYSCTMFYK